MSGRRGRCWSIFRTAGRRVVEVDAEQRSAGSGFQKICQAMEQRMIVRKTAAELEKMRRSGLLVWQILQKLKEMAVEGASTMDLEVAAEKMIADAGREAGVQGLLCAGGRRGLQVCVVYLGE